MRKLFVWGVVCCMLLPLCAQNSSSNYFVWQEDTLRLQAPAEAGKAWHFKPSRLLYDATWQLRVKMGFTPSSSNYALWYLTAAHDTSVVHQQGYCLRIGYTKKNIALCLQNDTKFTVLAETETMFLASTVDVHLRVTHSSEGLWNVYAKGALGDSLLLSVSNSSCEQVGYSGLACVYTATRSTKFSFCQAYSEGPDFQAPNPPAPGEACLSEILFYPYAGGCDFVELYNASSKTLNLTGLSLSNGKTTLALPSGSWPPYSYLVVCKSREAVASHYHCGEDALWIEASLPSLPTDSGSIILYNVDGQILDQKHYQTSEHHSLLEDVRGVSLERINYTENRWTSAAASAGYATPGLPNSQAAIAIIKPDQQGFWLENETFTPDGDGYRDLLCLRYALSQPTVCTVWIYNAQGSPVLQICSNALLSAEGVLQWDGADKHGRMSVTGVYAACIEAFPSSGKKWRQKIPFVLYYTP